MVGAVAVGCAAPVHPGGKFVLKERPPAADGMAFIARAIQQICCIGEITLAIFFEPAAPAAPFRMFGVHEPVVIHEKKRGRVALFHAVDAVAIAWRERPQQAMVFAHVCIDPMPVLQRGVAGEILAAKALAGAMAARAGVTIKQLRKTH